MKEQFAVFGSDARQAAAGRALARAGYAVGGAEQLATADYLLLPMPLDAQQLGLCRLLRAAKPGALALGARVTLAARSPAQRAHAQSLGMPAVPLTRLPALAPGFDTVVNTVPAPVLTREVLAQLPPSALIVDLASRPGGTDFAAAAQLGHTALHALRLPALCAPDSAGEAVAQTVLEILEERRMRNG